MSCKPDLRRNLEGVDPNAWVSFLDLLDSSEHVVVEAPSHVNTHQREPALDNWRGEEFELSLGLRRVHHGHYRLVDTFLIHPSLRELQQRSEILGAHARGLLDCNHVHVCKVLEVKQSPQVLSVAVRRFAFEN